MTAGPRVAVVGFMHEANALARLVGRPDGRRLDQSAGGLVASLETGAAVRRLRELVEVEVVVLPVWDMGARGPLRDDEFASIVDEIVEATRAACAAGPLDGVLVLGHGAGRTESDTAPDATLLAAVRAVVGPAVPMVVVLDFHANVSPDLCREVDVVVGYRTNPHVDIEERLCEAAEHLARMLGGLRTSVALSRPPMVLPQIAQSTMPGEALAEVRELAESLIGGPVWNVSLFGGFSLGDGPHCGVSVVVTADADQPEAAADAARRVARRAWELRHRYRTTLTPLVEAVAVARAASSGERAPVLLADTGDNPGGGAPATSTSVLASLLDAGVHDVVMGLQCDPSVVAAAWEAGVGGRATVTFNASGEDPAAAPLGCEATVLQLVDAPLVPTKGVYRGIPRHPGRCCALDLGGIRIAVSEHPVQCADDDTLLHVGLDPAGARVVVVKSRGHFRAGFAHLVPSDRILEVDAGGLAPATLTGAPTTHLRRPVFPLDDVESWEADALVAVRRLPA